MAFTEKFRKSPDRPHIWVQNITTAGIVDGANLSDKWRGVLFRYVGTKRYKTAAGSTKTVHLIEPLKAVDDK